MDSRPDVKAMTGWKAGHVPRSSDVFLRKGAAEVCVVGGETLLDRGEALRRTLRQLRSLQLATPLQMEVVEKLLEGRRNLPELVELIFHESSGDPEYKPHYMRVKRAADHLQSQGLVSTKVFGKNKPYHLTRYAVEMLTPIAGEPTRYRLLPRHDVLIYLARLSDVLSIDLVEAAIAKHEKNRAKYPADRVKGSAKKYSEY